MTRVTKSASGGVACQQKPCGFVATPDYPPLASWDRVPWQDRVGVFRRDLGDSEHAQIVIADEPTECVSKTLPEGLAGSHAGS
jgi:hypothetical protein